MSGKAFSMGRLSMGREVGTGHEWEKQVGGWNSVRMGTKGIRSGVEQIFRRE